MARACSDVLSILFYLLLLTTGCLSYVRVCYYTNWSQFRPSPSRFTSKDVDPTLCTHIIFAFADLKDTEIGPTEFNDVEMYRQLVSLKRDNPKLRILLAVGGWLAGGAQFSALVSSEDKMADFVQNVITYLRRNDFDGVDIDWEYPGDTDRGSEPADRIRFTRLLQVLREGFENEANITGRDRLLLSAAVVATIDLSREYYQIRQIGRSVDMVNLMAYDFHGQWDLSNGARHHSALYPESHNAVQGWLAEGFPPEKIVLGTAGFARTFSMAERPSGTGVGQRVLNVGIPGNFSDTEGLLTYQEICHLLRTGGWERVWIADQDAPAAFGKVGDGRWEWAGYDDVDSITAKARYVKEKGLAGAMLWAMSNDDFNNYCGQGAWPLLSALRNHLPDDDVSLGSAPELPPTLATTAPSTTLSNPVTIPYNSTRWQPPPRAGMTTTKAMTVTRGREGSGERAITVSPAPVPRHLPTPDYTTSYRQCSISDSFGPSLRCTSHHGKPGSRNKFYLYCFKGFFAIECSCLPGYFYNRCLQACDTNSNFLTCPFKY